jgi:hypothetical protein
VLCPRVLERAMSCSHIKVIVRERSSDRRVATVKPNRFGLFKVALDPGEYVIELQTSAGTPQGRAERISVEVRPHRFVRRLLATRLATGPADAGRLSSR